MGGIKILPTSARDFRELNARYHAKIAEAVREAKAAKEAKAAETVTTALEASTISDMAGEKRAATGEDEREAKRQRYANKIITLKVGPGKEELSIHEDLLREHSPFFKAALDKKWSEGQKGEIELPEDENDVVTAYIHWLYERKIVSAVGKSGHPSYSFLAKLYVFGEKVQCNGFCNDALAATLLAADTRTDKGGWLFPSASAVRELYKGTPPDSPARHVFIQYFADRGNGLWVTDKQPPEFLKDLTLELMKRRGLRATESMYERREQWMKKA